MGFGQLLLIAAGLSMDAFAVSICAGLSMGRALARKALTVGMYFGVFQAAMPLAGFLAAKVVADRLVDYGHWAAFAILAFLGVKMIAGSVWGDEPPEGSRTFAGSATSPVRMLPLAVATSVDALAVGVSFAFLRVRILPASLLIGVTTLVISAAGVMIGSAFGARFRKKAEAAGGAALILIGLKLLMERL